MLTDENFQAKVKENDASKEEKLLPPGPVVRRKLKRRREVLAAQSMRERVDLSQSQQYIIHVVQL